MTRTKFKVRWRGQRIIGVLIWPMPSPGEESVIDAICETAMKEHK